VIRGTKRQKIHRTQHPQKKIVTHNRYGLLINETNEDFIDRNPNSTNIHKPSPVFVHDVINYGEMIKRKRDIVEDEQYCSLENNVIK
jgi:hypothetical protein